MTVPKESSWHGIWIKCLTVILTVATSMMLYGGVKLIKNDLKVQIMWSAGYMTGSEIQSIISLIKAQNELIRALAVSNKEDIEKFREALIIIDERIYRLSTNTRGWSGGANKDQEGRLDSLLSRWNINLTNNANSE